MHTDIPEILKSRLNVPNRLQLLVQEFNLSQLRVLFSLVDHAMDELYYLSLGQYQIRNAVCYYTEHQKEGLFLVQKFNPNQRNPSFAVNYENCGITVEEQFLNTIPKAKKT